MIPLAAVTAVAAAYACVGSDASQVPPSTLLDGGPPGAPPPGTPSDGGDADARAPCDPSLLCQPANPCKKGLCDESGTCRETGNAPDGLACGAGAATVCFEGACIDRSWAQWPMPSWEGADAGPVPAYETDPVTDFEILTDTVTGLRWFDRGPTTPMTWAEAQAYCEGSSAHGSTDWRLPTTIEVVSIGAPTATGFADAFNTIRSGATDAGTATRGLWSSTPVQGTPGSHWSVSTLRVQASTDDTTFDVRCVR